MSHVVSRAFKTHIQRFEAGATVSEADDLAPHTLDTLLGAGFVVPEHAAPVTPIENVAVENASSTR